jgi:hypothetical protein
VHRRRVHPPGGSPPPRARSARPAGDGRRGDQDSTRTAQPAPGQEPRTGEGRGQTGASRTPAGRLSPRRGGPGP